MTYTPKAALLASLWPLEDVGASASFTETDEFDAAGGLNAKWTDVGYATHTLTQNGDGIFMWSQSSGGGNELGRFEQVISSPTSTFKYRAKIDYMSDAVKAQGAGIYVRNTVDDKWCDITHRDDGSSDANRGFYASNMSAGSANGFNSATAITKSAEASGGPYWVEIEQDSTNLYFRCSRNGVNWFTLKSIGKTSWITSGANRVGIVAWNITGGTVNPINFHWFRRMS